MATSEAPSKDRVRSPRPVISTVSTIPVRGARTLAENNAAIPTTAKVAGERFSSGIA